jgi:hypothetical protein
MMSVLEFVKMVKNKVVDFFADKDKKSVLAGFAIGLPVGVVLAWLL